STRRRMYRSRAVMNFTAASRRGRGARPVTALSPQVMLRNARASRKASGLLERALQRMLVLPGEVHHLVDLGFGHFVRKHAAHADAALVDVEHHPGRLLEVHAEEALKAHDD